MTTVNSILTSLHLFTISIVSELIMACSWIFIVIALYVLFKKINKIQAFLMVSFVLVGSAIICFNVIFQIAALTMVKNPISYLAVFDVNQLQSLALLFLEISRESVYANYIFLGLWMFPFAYFVYKSGYFPISISIIWGILLIIGGTGYLLDFFTHFLAPEYHISLTRFAFFGDLFSIIWLLLGGIRNNLIQDS